MGRTWARICPALATRRFHGLRSAPRVRGATLHPWLQTSRPFGANTESRIVDSENHAQPVIPRRHSVQEIHFRSRQVRDIPWESTGL